MNVIHYLYIDILSPIRDPKDHPDSRLQGPPRTRFERFRNPWRIVPRCTKYRIIWRFIPSYIYIYMYVYIYIYIYIYIHIYIYTHTYTYTMVVSQNRGTPVIIHWGFSMKPSSSAPMHLTFWARHGRRFATAPVLQVPGKLWGSGPFHIRFLDV